MRAAILIATLALPAAGLAQDAEDACGTRDAIVARLTDTYKESHRASGLDSDTKMVEVWASEETGSWTILVTEATGQSCIAAAGMHWLERMPAPKGVSG